MKSKIVWILKLENGSTFVGIGFLRRKLVWCQCEKIQQISLSDSLGKFWIITKLARDWKVSAVSDDAAFMVWTNEMQCALADKDPFLIDAEEARNRAPALNPKRKREITNFFQPAPIMFLPN